MGYIVYARNNHYIIAFAIYVLFQVSVLRSDLYSWKQSYRETQKWH